MNLKLNWLQKKKKSVASCIWFKFLPAELVVELNKNYGNHQTQISFFHRSFWICVESRFLNVLDNFWTNWCDYVFLWCHQPLAKWMAQSYPMKRMNELEYALTKLTEKFTIAFFHSIQCWEHKKRNKLEHMKNGAPLKPSSLNLATSAFITT